MTIDTFIRELLEKAQKAGLEAAEVYYTSRDSFKAMGQKGAISDYTVSTSGGLSLRGLYHGKMGYAATEAFDEDAYEQLIRGVKESAELIENDDVQEIYPGGGEYGKIDNYNPALDKVDEKTKLALVLSLEEKAKRKDGRIAQLAYNMVSTSSVTERIVNTYGLDLSRRDNYAVCYISALAKEGDRVATGSGYASTRRFEEVDADKIADMAVEEALYMLKAEPVASGEYRVIIDAHAMPDLLSTFSGVFSADAAQKGMSLLAGKEGETIASPEVTLLDDPYLPDGLDSRAFDAEGVATYTKAVIENGKLNTLLHNLKTARKAGVKTTGNASKAGYAGSIGVAPANFYFKPGTKTPGELMAEMGEGLVITEVSGLHAGANPVSGDFSLIAQGYTVREGKKADPVERITVAGNFYQLLKNIRAVGSDLVFPGSSFGSPSVDVGVLSVAGK